MYVTVQWLICQNKEVEGPHVVCELTEFLRRLGRRLSKSWHFQEGSWACSTYSIFQQIYIFNFFNSCSFLVPVVTSNRNLSWLKEIKLCANSEMQMRVKDISGPFSSDSDLQMQKNGDMGLWAHCLECFSFQHGFGHGSTHNQYVIYYLLFITAVFSF